MERAGTAGIARTGGGFDLFSASHQVAGAHREGRLRPGQALVGQAFHFLGELADLGGYLH